MMPVSCRGLGAWYDSAKAADWTNEVDRLFLTMRSWWDNIMESSLLLCRLVSGALGYFVIVLTTRIPWLATNSLSMCVFWTWRWSVHGWNVEDHGMSPCVNGDGGLNEGKDVAGLSGWREGCSNEMSDLLRMFVVVFVVSMTAVHVILVVMNG